MSLNYSTNIVHNNEKITEGIFKLTIKGNFQGKPGQFFMIKSWEGDPLLLRPISIYDITNEGISFLYQIVGKGTKHLTKLKSGDKVEILGPLGNGFPTEYLAGRVAMITGGIGIAPMFYAAKNMKQCNIDLYSGFRNIPYSLDEFRDYMGNIFIATEDGNLGTKGYVTDGFDPRGYDAVLCCGPELMMDKVVEICREAAVPVYVSMEKRMACGVGACLVCTCKTVHGNKRTCKDGPVFLGEDVVGNA